LSLHLQVLAQLLKGGQGIPVGSLITRAVKLRRAERRLEHLVEELLDVSRLASRKMVLDPRPVDLVAVVREMIDQASEQISAANCEVSLDAPQVLLGQWDGPRLCQVVTNLLTNAVKYGPGKPIRISVNADKTARITIRDQGIGISPEDTSRIFLRFERAVSERNYGGLGLGLWISKEIIEAHGGRIAVESALGTGSTFIVELPFDRRVAHAHVLAARAETRV
jgi:signal transduction histidine kinase